MRHSQPIERKTDERYPLVSVVIPTHNRKDKLIRLIYSVLQSNYPKNKLEIIVVDDASTDGTCAAILTRFQELISKETLKIVSQKKNIFLAKARNIGMSFAKGKYIFFVDDDNILDKDCVLHLVDVMESDSRIGVAGPLMFYYSCPNKIWCAGGKLNFILRPYHLFKGKDIRRIKLSSIIDDIDYFPNAYMVRENICAFVQHDDKNFPHNWEEQDFCIKIKRMGYKIVTVTNAKIWHDIDYDGYITRLGPFKTYDQAKSRIVFLRKYGNLFQKISFWAAVFPASTFYYLYKILTVPSDSKLEIIRSYIKGTIEGIKCKNLENN